jgi:hypothetical protein
MAALRLPNEFVANPGSHDQLSETIEAEQGKLELKLCW